VVIDLVAPSELTMVGSDNYDSSRSSKQPSTLKDSPVSLAPRC